MTLLLDTTQHEYAILCGADRADEARLSFGPDHRQQLNAALAEIALTGASWGKHPLPDGPWLGLQDSIHHAFRDEDR